MTERSTSSASAGSAQGAASSPSWQVALVLLGAPAFQALLFFASRLDLATFSRFAFVAGLVTEYVVLALVLVFLRQRGMLLADIGLTTERWPREVMIGLVAGILLFILAGVGGYLVEQILPSTISREPRPTWAALVYGFALLTAFAPIEEIVWRGYAMAFLEERMRSRWAVVMVTSVAFGALHWWGGPATIVMATVMGVAFSMLYLWRRTLTANIVAHFVLDLPLFLLMLFPVQPPTTG